MTPKRTLADEFLDWSKQRLEEIKAALAGLGDQADGLNAEARQQADLAIARIRAVRADFEAKISAMLPDSASAKTVSENAFADIAADWTEARVALREFFAAAGGQTTAVRKALAGVAQSRGRGEPSKFASTVNGSAARTARISCVVCAYNEADRIRRILEAVHDHPALAEVIVVNDGSTDDTEAILNDYPAIRAISYTPNRGKTYALTRGIAAATGDYLMFLDADLAGVNAADIQALAEPVIGGRAEVSISLRRNSLAPYRWNGLDFVSGERVIPAQLLDQAIVTAAGAYRALRAQRIRGPFEYGSRVIVEPADQMRLDMILDARALEVRAQGLEVFLRFRVQGIEQPRGAGHEVLHLRILAVQDSQWIACEPPPAVGVQFRLVRAEIGREFISIGGTRGRRPQ